MTADPFEHVVLPVAGPEDARATATAALPQIGRAGGRATLVHVVEKAGVEQREEYAGETFAAARKVLDGEVPVDERLAFGTDVADTIFSVAADLDATAITFTPRGGSRWVRLLTGDVALSLITKTDRPVVVLPASEADEDADGSEDTPDEPEGATDDG